MTWTSISTLDQLINSSHDYEMRRLDPNPKVFDTNLVRLDLSTPKISAIFAAVETAETLSSIGTVIHFP
jgi:hypothetical protein